MKQINQANRGKSLEDLVTLANKQYLVRGIAKVRKLPTPYRIQRTGKIMQAIPATKSGLDYVGVVQGGRAIVFDCKQTANPSLPLANFQPHQIDEATQWEQQGGLAFWLVEFTALPDAVYRVPHWFVAEYWRQAQMGGRKSIPRRDIDRCWEVQSRNGLALDYLAGMYEITEEAHHEHLQGAVPQN